jgi:predicted RNA-binding protein YlqC (UPF0109 family)
LKAMNDGHETDNQTLLRELVEALVQYPKSVKIKRQQQPDNGELMTLEVHSADLPRVFGGQGRHIQALRTIFQFIGARDEHRVRLLLIEPHARVAGAPLTPFVSNPDWKPEPVRVLLERVLNRVLAKPPQLDIYSGEGMTMIDIYADKDDEALCDGLTEYLKPIFHAIGKNQGRELFLESKQSIEIKRSKKKPAKR